MIELVLTLLSAFIYAGLFYLKSKQKDEDFDPLKFFVTILVGLIVGLIMYFTGIPITEQDFFTQLTAYAGLIMLLETVLKLVWRSRFPPPPSE